jgi:hypothetical protein
VTNGIPLGLSTFLPVGTVNFVQALKGCTCQSPLLPAMTMNSATTLMTSHNTEGLHLSIATVTGHDHELCHHTDGVTQH